MKVASSQIYLRRSIAHVASANDLILTFKKGATTRVT